MFSWNCGKIFWNPCIILFRFFKCSVISPKKLLQPFFTLQFQYRTEITILFLFRDRTVLADNLGCDFKEVALGRAKQLRNDRKACAGAIMMKNFSARFTAADNNGSRFPPFPAVSRQYPRVPSSSERTGTRHGRPWCLHTATGPSTRWEKYTQMLKGGI